MDTITVQLENIVIKLPETHLIIAKDDYQKLQERASKGQYWTLSDVLSLLSVSRPWLLDNVLYKPEIRSQIRNHIYITEMLIQSLFQEIGEGFFRA
ncbi:TPA: DUF771 domain-containing protein [Streptococcus suis]